MPFVKHSSPYFEALFFDFKQFSRNCLFYNAAFSGVITMATK